MDQREKNITILAVLKSVIESGVRSECWTDATREGLKVFGECGGAASATTAAQNTTRGTTNTQDSAPPDHLIESEVTVAKVFTDPTKTGSTSWKAILVGDGWRQKMSTLKSDLGQILETSEGTGEVLSVKWVKSGQYYNIQDVRQLPGAVAGRVGASAPWGGSGDDVPF